MLGSASHRVCELAARGEFDERHSAEEARPAARAVWDAEVKKGWQRILASPVRLADPPGPSRWPGYQVARLRGVGRALQDYRPGPRAGVATVPGHVRVEHELRDPASPLMGRIDRLEETRDGLVVVDLKSALRGHSGLRPAHRRQLLVYCYLVSRVEGRWPMLAAIRYLDGESDEMEVVPSEAETVAFELLALREDYEAAVAAGAGAGQLSRPSADSCAFCDYVCVCEPFFSSVDVGWEVPRPAVLGTVRGMDVRDGTMRLQLEVESASRVAVGCEVGVRGLPAERAPVTGSRVAFSGLRRDGAGDVLTVRWDSRYAIWG